MIYTGCMSDECVPAGISADDWAGTPVSVRTLVGDLQTTVAQLTQRVAALTEQVRQTSQNSSQPPSADPPSAPPRPKRPPSGRKAGAQAGHVGHTRVLKPAAEGKQFVDFKPASCAQCGALLMGDDPAPERRQVTEYRRHALTGLVCQHTTEATWPTELPDGSFGPRVQATVGYLTGRLGISQWDVEEVMESLFHTDVSLGSVSALEQAVSAALAQPVAAVQTYMQAQPAVNADETSWREGKARYWVWLAPTPWGRSFSCWPAAVPRVPSNSWAPRMRASSVPIAGRATTGSPPGVANSAGHTSNGTSKPSWTAAGRTPRSERRAWCRPTRCLTFGIVFATVP